MTTVWGPYVESYDTKTGLHSLFKLPAPSPVSRSKSPILKEPVSLLLTELIKPLRVQATPVVGASISSSVEGPDESAVRAAIAMMDGEVVRKVRAASDSREALAILTLYDPRFEDLSNSEALRETLLGRFRLQISAPQRHRGPGRPQSAERQEIREHIESNLEHYGPLLYERKAKDRYKARTSAAHEICRTLYQTDNLKEHPMIRVVLREGYPYRTGAL